MPAPALDPRLAALLGRVWARLPAGVLHAGALGFSWAEISMPSIRWEGERAVGHVGVIELPLVIGGRLCAIGSIHAVCTDPERRGHGLGRALMEEALAGAGARFETLILTTAIPDFYVKFGFRPVREHAFSRPLPARRPSPGGRALSPTPDDVRLLRRLLEQRTAVSHRFGSLERGTVFVIALMLTWGDLSRAWYHEALDVVTVHEVRDRTLVLYDVVGTTIPPLAALAAAIGADADRVIALFPPDRLGDGFVAEPYDAARARELGDDHAGLMARGPLAVEGEPFMVPPLTRT